MTEDAVRISLDARDPDPTFDVLAAVIRLYGVDPNWLITGIYDANAHRAVLLTSDEHEVDRAVRAILHHPRPDPQERNPLH